MILVLRIFSLEGRTRAMARQRAIRLISAIFAGHIVIWFAFFERWTPPALLRHSGAPATPQEQMEQWLVEGGVPVSSAAGCHLRRPALPWSRLQSAVPQTRITAFGSAIVLFLTYIRDVEETWGRRLPMHWYLDAAPPSGPPLAHPATVIDLSGFQPIVDTRYKDERIVLRASDYHLHFFKTLWVLQDVARKAVGGVEPFASSQWFFKLWEDTFPITENIDARLAKFDAAQPVVLGEAQVRGGSLLFLGGGAGWIISRAAMLRMQNLTVCFDVADDIAAAEKSRSWTMDDVLFSQCFLRKLGVALVPVTGLYMFPPWKRDYVGNITVEDLRRRAPIAMHELENLKQARAAQPEDFPLPDGAEGPVLPLSFHYMLGSSETHDRHLLLGMGALTFYMPSWSAAELRRTRPLRCLDSLLYAEDGISAVWA
jgi:hypothetical protein